MKAFKNIQNALFLGAALLLPATASQAQMVEELEFRVKTGGDDLRNGGLLFGQFVMRDGRETPRFRINLRDGNPVGLPNGSEQVFKITLPEPISPAFLATSKFIITHDGEPRNFGDGYDNWNLDDFSITDTLICKGGETITETPGTSGWARFTGAQTDFVLKIVPPGTRKAIFPPSLVLKITTGADDRRSNADSKVFVTLKGGRRLPAVAISGTSGQLPWINLPLPSGTTPWMVDSITITHNGAGGRNITESYDNWDVSKVVVAMPVQCTRKTWLSVSGRPWKRFTGQNRSVTTTLYPRIETVVNPPIERQTVFGGSGF